MEFFLKYSYKIAVVDGEFFLSAIMRHTVIRSRLSTGKIKRSLILLNLNGNSLNEIYYLVVVFVVNFCRFRDAQFRVFPKKNFPFNLPTNKSIAWRLHKETQNKGSLFNFALSRWKFYRWNFSSGCCC